MTPKRLFAIAALVLAFTTVVLGQAARHKLKLDDLARFRDQFGPFLSAQFELRPL